jgi:hypothetical protein
MPYKKSMRLINNIDKLEIIYYPEGMIEYKIYLLYLRTNEEAFVTKGG